MPAPQASAAVADWQQKGISFYPYSPTDFDSDAFRATVNHYKGLGVNTVTLVVQLYQSNTGSTDIAAGGNTPTDAALASAIQYVHAQGMQVMIKIHLDTRTGEWRANINPGDRDTWYANYLTQLKHYAQIAAAQHAEAYCIGTELIDMASSATNPDNTQRWQNMIGQVRQLYSGKLTYSANWGASSTAGEAIYIQFWPSLDFIGISGYYPLSGDGSVAQSKAAWTNWLQSEIQPLHDRTQKPVVFTEIGYRSVTDAHDQPYASWITGAYDPQEQTNDYEALFEFWNAYPYLQGIDMWYAKADPNAGGAGDTDYFVQNKPVEQTLKQWFTSNTPPTGTTTPPGTPAFTVSGNANPAQGPAGQPVTLSLQVTDSGGAAVGTNVDVEIYDSSNHQVLQKVFSNQNFSANQTQQYSFAWTPSAAGTYTVKAGIFDSAWKLYTWNDSVTRVTVGSGSVPPPPPPGNASIQVWWPTNGSAVSGVQPFKALVSGMALSAYSMYWQVDGGTLNAMADNQTDAPHKEALVDVSGWNWRGSGPYQVNFVAKDTSGAMMAQSPVSITVAH